MKIYCFSERNKVYVF